MDLSGHSRANSSSRANPGPFPQLRNVDVAISRTEPAINGGGVREIETLYLDMIAAARHSIYIENQYFTGEKIGDAFAARLVEPDGPEIIVVLRELSHGWLEELTMQTLRTRLIEKLRVADRFDRLRVFYPYIAGLGSGTCIDVHSKMMIVDDDIVRIGSANLANRSMGLDTECDLTIESAGRSDVRHAIQHFRAQLLGEHVAYRRYEPRGALDVELAIGERRLRVIATHLGLRRSERHAQWQRLFAAIREGPTDLPLIVAGDMNEWFRRARILGRVCELFGQPPPPAPAAFPSFAPIFALTRIWVRPCAALLGIDVHRSAEAKVASDHLPVKATLDAGQLWGGAQAKSASTGGE